MASNNYNGQDFFLDDNLANDEDILSLSFGVNSEQYQRMNANTINHHSIVINSNRHSAVATQSRPASVIDIGREDLLSSFNDLAKTVNVNLDYNLLR